MQCALYVIFNNNVKANEIDNKLFRLPIILKDYNSVKNQFLNFLLTKMKKKEAELLKQEEEEDEEDLDERYNKRKEKKKKKKKKRKKVRKKMKKKRKNKEKKKVLIIDFMDLKH